MLVLKLSRYSLTFCERKHAAENPVDRSVQSGPGPTEMFRPGETWRGIPLGEAVVKWEKEKAKAERNIRRNDDHMLKDRDGSNSRGHCPNKLRIKEPLTWRTQAPFVACMAWRLCIMAVVFGAYAWMGVK